MPHKRTGGQLVEALRRALPGVRRTRGWTQDDLAAYLSATGLPWTRDTVHAFEGGRRTLTVEEWFVLLALLRLSETHLFGTELIDLGLIQGEAGLLADILTGSGEDDVQGRRWVEEDATALETRREVIRTAEAVGLAPGEIGAVARRLWQNSLVRERDRRVADRVDGRRVGSATLARIRGRVITERRRELRAELARRRKRGN